VLEFDDNDVDCERDDEIVVFVRVDDVFDESDCELDVGELDVVGVEIDGGGGNRRVISKISTTSESLFELFCPPPKNSLFVDDVDTRKLRGSERFTVNQVLLVRLNISTTDEDVEPFKPPPNATISPIDDAARKQRDSLSVEVLHVCDVELKISTIVKIVLPIFVKFPSSPPPKKAKFPSDVAARSALARLSFVVFHIPLNESTPPNRPMPRVFHMSL
jgi:hypothetical protein